MPKPKPKGSTPGVLEKVRKPSNRIKKIQKLPRSIYDSRAGISKTKRMLDYEQAQSWRWLKQHARGSQSISEATQRELLEFFKCRTIEQLIEARSKLTVESQAIMEILEAERERSRAVQGGVANPNDWFLTPTEENILANLMSNATLDETEDAKPKNPERSKVEQAVADFEEQEARDKSAKANGRSRKQPRSDEQEEPRLAKTKTRARNRRRRFKKLKERELHQGHLQAELDPAGGPSGSEPVSGNVRHLFTQRWLGGKDPNQTGPPRRSERLRQQEEVEQAGGLELVQAARMMDQLDIRMEQ